VGEKIKKPANDKFKRKNNIGERKSSICMRLAFRMLRVNSMDKIPTNTSI
jgi:hypothetical protein